MFKAGVALAGCCILSGSHARKISTRFAQSVSGKLQKKIKSSVRRVAEAFHFGPLPLMSCHSSFFGFGSTAFDRTSAEWHKANQEISKNSRDMLDGLQHVLLCFSSQPSLLTRVTSVASILLTHIVNSKKAAANCLPAQGHCSSVRDPASC